MSVFGDCGVPDILDAKHEYKEYSAANQLRWMW